MYGHWKSSSESSVDWKLERVEEGALDLALL
jgi:hypothetical protein